LSQKRTAVSFLILSATVAGFIIAGALLRSPDPGPIENLEKLLVGGAFIGSAILGVILAIRPNPIRRLTKQEVHGASEQSHEERRNRQGHHPNCKEFRSHVIRMDGKGLCAGCTGLALGSTVSILLAVVFLLLPEGMPHVFDHVLIGLGLAFVAFNYAEAVVSRSAISHLTSNVLLVEGFLLLVFGVFRSTGDAGFGILGVILSFLLLDTRIQLSNWRHAQVCASCKETCKSY
jgi:hypothetical protein